MDDKKQFNRVCAWCQVKIGEQVKGRQTTHSICPECKATLLARPITQQIEERLPHPVVRK